MRTGFKLLFFVLVTQLVFGQDNLILNPSLEQWEEYMPKNWRIVSESVDIFKSNLRVIPPISPDDTSFAERFPLKGSDGITYFGIAQNEIIEGELTAPLVQDQYYTFSFWVSKPRDYSSKIANNKMSVKFTKFSAPKEIECNKIKNYIVIFSCDGGKFDHTEWKRATVSFKAKGGEKYFQVGFFKDLNSELGLQGLTVYNQFDNFELYEGENIEKSRLSIYYKKNGYKLSKANREKINIFLKENKNTDKLVIKSYASKLGSDKYNENLGQRRKEFLLKYIKKIQSNIAIEAENFGERLSTESNNKYWRRVDISIDKCKEIKKEVKPKRNQELMALLKKIEQKDQGIRKKYEDLFQRSVVDSALLKKVESEMQYYDSINISKNCDILDKYGYPGLSLVGQKYMDISVLILLHSPLEIRLRYMDLVLQAAKSYELSKYWLPYLLDRNKIDQGEKQIYGTQLKWDDKKNIYISYPINDIQSVDTRRKEFNLGKLNDYLKLVNSK